MLHRLLAILTLACLVIPVSAQAATKSDTLNAHMREITQNASKEQTLNALVGPHLPTTALHTEFVVETNNKGQVTRIRSGKNSQDRTFDLMTYGNALQIFIRTASGHADAGTFRVTYDYSPTSHVVTRGVGLIALGGVDPNAEGAVYALARAQAAASHKPH